MLFSVAAILSVLLLLILSSSTVFCAGQLDIYCDPICLLSEPMTIILWSGFMHQKMVYVYYMVINVFKC
jgi:hypothetical protein